jgi:hypothetical protein
MDIFNNFLFVGLGVLLIIFRKFFARQIVKYSYDHHLRHKEKPDKLSGQEYAEKAIIHIGVMFIIGVIYLAFS